MLLNLKTLIMIELLLMIGLTLFRFSLATRHRETVNAKVVVLTLLTPAVALLSGQIYVFYAYLVLIVACNSRSRADLSSIFLVMLPMTPLLNMEAVIGGVYIMPWSTVTSMCVGALIGFLVTPPRRALNRPAFDLAAVLLVVLFIYITCRGISTTGAFRLMAIAILATVGPYLLLSRGVSDRASLDLCLLRLALGGTMASIVAGFQTLRHWVLYQGFNDALNVPLLLGSATLSMRAGFIRTGGPMLDYSAAGIFFGAVLVTLPFLKSRFRGVWFWLILAVLVVGLLATQSRGAWIGTAVGFLFLLFYRSRYLQASLLAGAVAIVQFVVIPSLSDSRFAETVGAGGASTFTTEYRKRLLTRGLEQVQANPIFGQTTDQLIASLPDLEQGQHIVDFVNSHLYIAMAAGVPGFLIWCVIWSLPIAGSWRYRKLASPDSNPAEVPAAIIVVVMTALAATSLVDRNLAWPTVALAIAGPCFALTRLPRGGRQDLPQKRPPLVIGLSREETAVTL